MGDPSSLELYFTQGQGPGQILHNKMQKETKKVSRQHVNCAAGESCAVVHSVKLNTGGGEVNAGRSGS